ncbi:MAG: methyltransferase domain-containing protein [Woeseiaceae bacterium]
MRALITLAATTVFLATGIANAEHHEAIADSIADSNRAEANSERDGARKPDQVLEFIDLNAGDVVLDYGAGGGYWAELFSGVVGDGGKVYAHQRAGERYEEQKAAFAAQFAPFGNIELMPLDSGAAFPLGDGTVDSIMVSYLFHHMHYADGSGEMFPDSSKALFGEFQRVLKPGGTIIIIEHAAVDGSGRAESGGWHRTPPEMAKTDLASIGLEFVADAPEIFHNPDDDRKNIWFETGLQGKTTTFVQKYRNPD